MTAPIRNNNVIDPFSWDKNVIDFKGYNGSPNLKKSGIKVNWTQEMLDEWIKCAKDPVYFSERYIKIVHVDRGLIPIQLYDYQKEVIEKSVKSRKIIVNTSRQIGKALALDTDIPLFSGGFKKIGDIEIGDVVIGNDGNPTTVTFLSDIHNKKTFKLTFSDGSQITACEDHLWEVSDSWNGNKKSVLTTSEISKKYKRESYKKNNDDSLRKIQENKYYIENTSPVNYEKRDLDIDPYILGVWLGDGESAGGRITCHVDDKENYEKHGIKFSTETSHSKRKNIWTSTVVGLMSGLRQYDLIKNKHIPHDYLYSSVEDRISLLQGLMDTDGYIQKSGAVLEFVQSIDRHAFVMQVKQLMESLGLTVYYKEKVNKKYNKSYCYLTFSVSHSQFKPFRLERKLERLKESVRKSATSRYIVDVAEVESVPTKCLTVDNANHMFLCGSQYIPTHNTTVATCMLLHYILFNAYKTVALLANKGDAALEIMSRIQLAYEYLPKWLQSGVIEWNKGSIELENGCKILASATSGSAIRGKSINWVYIDEAAFVDNWFEFYSSVYPTISSGKDTKILFTSCVPKGTLVYTDTGIHDVSEFVNDDKNGFYSVPAYSLYGHGGLRDGNLFFNNGLAETRIFRTSAGEVESSLPHKFFCCTKEGEYKWVEAKDINVGDYMIQIVGQNCFGKTWDISMPTIEGRTCKNKFIITDENKVHIAYFLGQLLSDGYARESYACHQITITSTDDLHQIFERIGLKCKSYDGLHYTVNSKELVRFIKHIGIDINKKAKEKEIPSCILTAPKEIQASFLRGFMDGDGCARINDAGKVTVTVGLASKKMIQQLNAMLCNFGIFSNYYSGTVKASTKPNSLVKVDSTYYRLEIVGADSVHKYFNEIGFAFQRKQVFKEKLQNHMLPDHVVPFSRKILRDENATDIWSGVHKNGNNFSIKTLLEIKPIVEKNNYYGSEKIKFLFENFVNENIRFIPVKEIRTSENEVYDFSLPDNEDDFFCHSVLYNSILGHQTPNGLNHFYKFREDAISGINGFELIEVPWHKIPGRDEAWKQETLSGMNFDYERFEVEFNCEFMGSSGTLVSGSALKVLTHKEPIYKKDGFNQYVIPDKSKAYVILCDVSRGKGLDYSAFSVIDVSVMPYVQVATYKSNVITPTDYAFIINKIGLLYNTASVLIELNDIGAQVADILFDDYDYDNLLFTMTEKGRNGKSLCGGGSNADRGVRTTTAVKAKGCSILKLLIEQQQLIINDFDTINELSRFSKKGKSYEAEDSSHDDMVMGLVLFSWMTTQPYFSNITDINTLHNLRDEDAWDDFVPFGYILDGSESDIEVDNEGRVWMHTDAWHMNY